MKPLFISVKKNNTSIINIKKLNFYEKDEYKEEEYYIRFYFDKHVSLWIFNSKEKRDKAFNEIGDLEF